jgi:16S rRNA G966 N2-methylase RsmD
VGKGKGGYGHRLPVFIPHIDMNVNLLSSKWFQTAQGYKDVGQTKDVRGQGKCNSSIPPNMLFYGDNLAIMREYIPDESIDLVYLDPPFNSNRNYNVLFSDESGKEAEAQIEAFEDTWHWSHAAEETYHES